MSTQAMASFGDQALSVHAECYEPQAGQGVDFSVRVRLSEERVTAALWSFLDSGFTIAELRQEGLAKCAAEMVLNGGLDEITGALGDMREVREGTAAHGVLAELKAAVREEFAPVLSTTPADAEAEQPAEPEATRDAEPPAAEPLAPVAEVPEAQQSDAGVQAGVAAEVAEPEPGDSAELPDAEQAPSGESVTEPFACMQLMADPSGGLVYVPMPRSHDALLPPEAPEQAAAVSEPVREHAAASGDAPAAVETPGSGVAEPERPARGDEPDDPEAPSAEPVDPVPPEPVDGPSAGAAEVTVTEELPAAVSETDGADLASGAPGETDAPAAQAGPAPPNESAPAPVTDAPEASAVGGGVAAQRAAEPERGNADQERSSELATVQAMERVDAAFDRLQTAVARCHDARDESRAAERSRELARQDASAASATEAAEAERSVMEVGAL